MSLKVCIAQLNFVVGDLRGNAQKIIRAATEAYQNGARLVLTPELSICGYAGEDLFLRTAFVAACEEAVQTVARALSHWDGLCVVVGHPTGDGRRTRSVAMNRRFNAASVLSGGRVVATYAKHELPNYQVFDERRYFSPGQDVCVFPVGCPGAQVQVGLLICEDAWFETPARLTKQAGAELLAVINASPFHVGKDEERRAVMRDRVLECQLPMICAHLVGGQDEMVFEGRSFALDADGSIAGSAPGFRECNWIVQVDRVADAPLRLAADTSPSGGEDADLWDALVLGVHDYVDKNGFPSVVLGLSGGIDSALVLTIAVDALGPDRVRAVMMPSPYTADISLIDASDIARRLGVRYDEWSIVPEFEAFKAALRSEFDGLAEDTTEENIQARIRGVLLMAISNKFGALVLATGNKSELATGYCTLYGDMVGGFAVIKDVSKTTVFRLARWRNANDPYHRGRGPIPDRIIARAPSAELRWNQVDQDSLPPYEVLDAIVERYMENDDSIESLVAAGYAVADVERVTRLIKINEYKRRQAPIGIRVTHRSFGKDWRYPITNKFRA